MAPAMTDTLNYYHTKCIFVQLQDNTLLYITVRQFGLGQARVSRLCIVTIWQSATKIH